MNVTTQTQPAWLLREFTDLRSSLERHDANLTAWERHGSTYPSRDVDATYSALALRFDTARTELARVRPDATSLNARLQRDALWISKVAGQVNVMSQHQTVFGRGWSTSFDQPIVDTIAAINLLIGA